MKQLYEELIECIESDIEEKRTRGYYADRNVKCSSGKLAYRTYGDAQKALKTIKNKDNKKYIYKCNYCGCFHFSTRLPKDSEIVKRSNYKDINRRTKIKLNIERIDLNKIPRTHTTVNSIIWTNLLSGKEEDSK